MSNFTGSGCAWIIVGTTLIICGFMSGGIGGVMIGLIGCCLVIGSHLED